MRYHNKYDEIFENKEFYKNNTIAKYYRVRNIKLDKNLKMYPAIKEPLRLLSFLENIK